MSLRATVLAGVAAVWLLSFATLGFLTTQLSTTHAQLLGNSTSRLASSR